MLLAHSRIGASSAKRWMACPGSVDLLHRFPMPSNAAANEGTLAHELGENILHERIALAELDKEISPELEEMMCEDYNDKTIENVMMYVNIVWAKYTFRRSQGYNVKLAIELRVKVSSVHADAFGTLDAAVICEEGPVDIYDYKNGHADVEVEENPQAMYYAIGLQDECMDEVFTEFHLHIVQPNSGGHKEWQPTLKELDDFAKECAKAADAVYVEDAPRIVGPQCNLFCNRVACPEYKAKKDEASNVVFTALDIEPIDEVVSLPDAPDVSLLSVDQMGRLLELEEFVKNMANDAKKLLKAKGMNGEDMGDYKLIQGKGNYKLNAEASELSKVLRLPQAKITDTKVKSKTAIEKLIKTEFKDKNARLEKINKLNGLCFRPDGEIKLVRKDHKGEDYAPVQFAALED